jgi:No apical meristem (NAM) protein
MALSHDEQLGGGEGERYFFTTLEDVKRCRGNKSIRTTNSGFWKAKGKAKVILSSRGGGIVLVGTKMTFIFHWQERKRSQNITSASRTSWIMDEYRLSEMDALSCYIRQNAAMINVSN